MKKVLFAIAAVALFGTFQSCSKCGHCHTETTYNVGGSTTTSKNDGNITCGNDANETGSYYKEAKLTCESWPDRMKAQNPGSSATYTSSWIADK